MLQQGFRPSFRRLEASGHRPVPQAESGNYDLTLLLCGRHRGQNELWIAEALKRTRPGGWVVVAGSKTNGAASLRKRVAGLVPIEDHASKNHGVVFWLARPENAQAAIERLEQANPPLVLDGGFVTAPGVFSQEHADAGSQMLADNLPGDIRGHVADFGAGWGYLAAQAIDKCPGINSVELYEADHASLEAARLNLAGSAKATGFHWQDLASEPVPRSYDAVLMNPPFHQGRAAEPSIGEGMIRSASKALKPGGRLFLVANRQLPYEAVLGTCFARSGETVRSDRFKILWAVR